MKKLLDRVIHVGSPASFALALLLFLLPFLSVSCDAPGGYGRMTAGGTTSYSGLDLAIGSSPAVDDDHVRPAAEQQADNLGVQPLILVAALATLGALVVVVARRRSIAGPALGALAAALLVIGLVFARSSLVDRVGVQAADAFPQGKSASDYVSVDLGFWLVTGLLVVGSGQVAPDAIDKAVASFPPEKFAGVVFNQRP